MFRLATKDGAHVADVNVPPFKDYPDVLIWGERVFQFHSAATADGDPCTAEYREAFCFAVPIPLSDRSSDTR